MIFTQEHQELRRTVRAWQRRRVNIRDVEAATP